MKKKLALLLAVVMVITTLSFAFTVSATAPIADHSVMLDSKLIDVKNEGSDTSYGIWGGAATTEEAFSGTNAVKLVGNGSYANYEMWSGGGKLSKDNTYYVSFYVKGTASTSVSFDFEGYDAYCSATSYTLSSSDWEKVEFAFAPTVAPSEGAHTENGYPFRVYTLGSDTFYIDDISIWSTKDAAKANSVTVDTYKTNMSYDGAADDHVIDQWTMDGATKTDVDGAIGKGIKLTKTNNYAGVYFWCGNDVIVKDKEALVTFYVKGTAGESVMYDLDDGGVSCGSHTFATNDWEAVAFTIKPEKAFNSATNGFSFRVYGTVNEFCFDELHIATLVSEPVVLTDLTTLEVNKDGGFVELHPNSSKPYSALYIDNVSLTKDVKYTLSVDAMTNNIALNPMFDLEDQAGVADISVAPKEVEKWETVTAEFTPNATGNFPVRIYISDSANEGQVLLKNLVIKAEEETIVEFTGKEDSGYRTADSTYHKYTEPSPWKIVDANETDYVEYYTAEGKYCDLDSLNTDNQVDESGTWQFSKGGHLQNSTGIFGNYVKGAAVQLTFNGTGIKYITQYRGPQTADIDIYIDGEKVATKTGLSAEHDTSNYVIYSVEDLTEGEHTFMAVAATAGQMPVDYFEVKGEPVTAERKDITVPFSWKIVDAAETDYVEYYTAEGKYCDLDSLIAANTDAKVDESGTWQFFNGGHLQNSTGIFGIVTGAAVQLTFNGTGIKYITQYRGPQTADIDIYIDGEKVATKTGLSAEHDTSNYVIYSVEDLTEDEHTFMAVAATAGQMPVDYFEVKGEPVAAERKDITVSSSWKTVDAAETDYVEYYTAEGKYCDLDSLIAANTDAKVDESGAWQFFNGGHLQNSTGIFGIVKGAAVQLTFNGTGIKYITQYRGPQTADIDIYIDGEKVATKTGLSAEHDTSNYVIYSVEDLTEGEHTFMAVAATAGQMPVDYFEVKGEPVTAERKDITVPEEDPGKEDEPTYTNLYKLDSCKDGGFVEFKPTADDDYAGYYMRAKLEKGKTYTVSFRAISNKQGISIKTDLENAVDADTSSVTVTETDKWIDYSMKLTPKTSYTESSDKTVKELGFPLRVYVNQNGAAQIFIDDIKVTGPDGKVIISQDFTKNEIEGVVTWMAKNTNFIPAGFVPEEEGEVLGYNELINGDFEDAGKMKYWWSRSDWNGGYWQREEGKGVDGSAALVGHGKGTGLVSENAGCFYTIMGEGKEASLSLKAGKTYVLSYQVFRPEGVDSYTYIDINEGQVTTAAATKNGEWETVSARFVAPEGALKIRLVANGLATGEVVYVDNIELREVGGDPNGTPDTSDNMPVMLLILAAVVSVSACGIIITQKHFAK